jgi:hypothetical protein
VKSNAKEVEKLLSLLQLECDTYVAVLYRCQMKKSIQNFSLRKMMDGQKSRHHNNRHSLDKTTVTMPTS